MSREVRRVPLDFNWPLKQVWQGYLMPAELQLPECLDCTGSGETAGSQWLRGIVHLLMTAADDPRQQEHGRPMHPYLNEVPVYNNDRRPTADLLELVQGLAPDVSNDSFFGFSTSDDWRVSRAIVTAAGQDPERWGICAMCKGSGELANDEQRAAVEAWEPTEPPTGDGWQLWETTSEGSPTSPVFATGDELARWMSTNPCGFAGSVIALDVAMRWVHGSGWSPSLVLGPNGLQDGITAMAQERVQ